MFDRKSFVIGILTLTAAILTVGHLQLATPANANVSVMDEDFQLVTARTNRGDDGVYILHKRKNLVALFTWDASKRMIVARDVKSLDVAMPAR
jgi:hypothetical protein